MVIKPYYGLSDGPKCFLFTIKLGWGAAGVLDCPQKHAGVAPGWPRGRAGHPAGGGPHAPLVRLCSLAASPHQARGRQWHVDRHEGQTVKLRGNPEGQRGAANKLLAML